MTTTGLPRAATAFGLALLATGLFVGVPASAAGPTAPATRTVQYAPTAAAAGTAVTVYGESDVVARRCYVTPRKGVRAVIIRKYKSTRSAAIGQINRGERGRAKCTANRGGWYSIKGCKKSNWWIKTKFRTKEGWVAWGCVNWHYRR